MSESPVGSSTRNPRSAGMPYAPELENCHPHTGSGTESCCGHVAKEFFSLVVAEAKHLNLMSDEHFTVDGTLLEACASLKSFKKVEGGGEPPVDDPGNPTVDFHGESRSNQKHVSTTDADALLARKGTGKEAKLSYSGHVLMENRNGLVADVEVLQANGTAERDAALVMIAAIPGDHPVTVGGDKGYDTRDFVAEARNLKATPHVAQNIHARRRSAIDGRTTRHAGYGIRQVKRKRVEEIFEVNPKTETQS